MNISAIVISDDKDDDNDFDNDDVNEDVYFKRLQHVSHKNYSPH